MVACLQKVILGIYFEHSFTTARRGVVRCNISSEQIKNCSKKIFYWMTLRY
jgi:hypothetical protein